MGFPSTPPPPTCRERKGSWVGVGVGGERRQERKEILGDTMRKEKKSPRVSFFPFSTPPPTRPQSVA